MFNPENFSETRDESSPAMNQDPPPLGGAPAPPDRPIPTAPQSSGSGGKVLLGCGLGCLALVVAGIVGGVFLVSFGKGKLADLAAAYAADEPLAIEQPVAAPGETEESIARFERFREGLRSGQVSEPLVVSDRDINALIFNHPDFEALAGRTAVRIEDDQLHATVSLELDEIDIPFGFLEDALRGKYFNGEVALSIGTLAGRPAVFIEDLQVGGRSLPRQILDEMRNENLLKDALSDPDSREFFDRIQSLRIEGDRLVIVPAPAGAAPR